MKALTLIFLGTPPEMVKYFLNNVCTKFGTFNYYHGHIFEEPKLNLFYCCLPASSSEPTFVFFPRKKRKERNLTFLGRMFSTTC